MMELKIGDEKTKEEFLLGAFPNKIVMTVQNPFHLSSFTQQFNFALLQCSNLVPNCGTLLIYKFNCWNIRFTLLFGFFCDIFFKERSFLINRKVTFLEKIQIVQNKYLFLVNNIMTHFWLNLKHHGASVNFSLASLLKGCELVTYSQLPPKWWRTDNSS